MIKLYKATTAAEMYGVSFNTVYNRIRSGVLVPVLEVASRGRLGKTRYFTEEDLEEQFGV